MSIFVLNIPLVLQVQIDCIAKFRISLHNKNGNDGMGRLAKIARTQLRKVVELAKPAKMVRENPVSQICKMESVSIHNKKGNDGMGRLAKIARTQLRKVVELAKPAKMVRENPVSQICKM